MLTHFLCVANSARTQMAETGNCGAKRALLGVSLAVNIGLLFTFKYLDLFNDALTDGLARTIP